MTTDQQKSRTCDIVVDSCCDLPREFLEEAGVAIIEFPVMLDGRELKDDMWLTMQPKDYYDSLRNGASSSTAQVPMADYVELFNRIAQSGRPTVVLSFSSGLSGSFNTAQVVLQQVKANYPDAKIHLVDTMLASIAEGLLVMGAVRQRDRGLGADELAQWAAEARYYVHGYFTLDSLEWLKKGGRIPPVIAALGTKLDIKPLLSFDLDGNLTNLQMVRGKKKALKAINTLFVEKAVDASQTSVIIASADAQKDAGFVEEQAGKHCKLHHVVHSTIGPVIGSHVGPGMTAFAFWGSDRRKDATIADRIANSISRKSGAKGAAADAASQFAHDASDEPAD